MTPMETIDLKANLLDKDEPFSLTVIPIIRSISNTKPNIGTGLGF